MNRNENSWLELVAYHAFLIGPVRMCLYLILLNILTENISIQKIPILYEQNTYGTVLNFYMTINLYFVDHISCSNHHFSLVSVSLLVNSTILK